MRYVVVAALAALVASAAPVAAQSTGSANGEVAAPTKPAITKDSTGRILGVIDADTDQPVVGAEAVDKVTGVTAAFTNEHGVVRLGSFRSQDDSSVVVTIRKIGYQDTTLRVIKNDTTPITLMLEALVPVLPKMLTEAMAKRSDLEGEAVLWGAKFIPPGLLRSDKYRGKSLGDALRDFQMIGRVLTNYDTQGLRPGERPKGCFMQIVLDYSLGAGSQVTVDDQAGMYDGALFFSKQTPLPAEYQKFGGCDGTLLLFSKAR